MSFEMTPDEGSRPAVTDQPATGPVHDDSQPPATTRSKPRWTWAVLAIGLLSFTLACASFGTAGYW